MCRKCLYSDQFFQKGVHKNTIVKTSKMTIFPYLTMTQTSHYIPSVQQNSGFNILKLHSPTPFPFQEKVFNKKTNGYHILLSGSSVQILILKTNTKQDN